MPNWCENKLVISGDPKDLSKFIKKYFTKKDFDFNKIIPEPKTINKCPDEFIVRGKSHIVPDDDRPWFDWYHWHLFNWGTKWGACDTYLYKEEDYIIILFNTAWSPCIPVIMRLTELHPELTFDYYFFESGCWFAGQINKDEDGYDIVYHADNYIKQFSIEQNFMTQECYDMMEDDEDDTEI